MENKSSDGVRKSVGGMEGNISARMRLIREELGLTQSEFSEKIKIHTQSLSKIERGAVKASESVISKILISFPEVSKSFIIDGTGSPLKSIKSSKSHSDDGFYSIPRFEVEMAERYGEKMHKEKTLKSVAFRKEWIDRLTGNPERLVLFEVVNDFMEPILKEHDLILIDRSQQRLIEGKLFFVRIDDQYSARVVEVCQVFSKSEDGTESQEAIRTQIVLRYEDNRSEDTPIDIRYHEPGSKIGPTIEGPMVKSEVIGKIIWLGREV